MRALLAELTALLAQGKPGVFCSVVETRGSTPQKAGAGMLILPDGSQKGTLGGGCVEAEVKQRALRVLGEPSPEPQVITFALDDDHGWDDGMICGGRMTIVADPLVRPSPGQEVKAYFDCFQALIESGKGCTEAVALNEQAGATPGSRYLFSADGMLAAQLATVVPPASVDENLPAVRQRPRPSTRQGMAYLPIWPRVSLLIVGAGHVGQAVARLAADVDFDIWVIDDRETFASRERFPSAQRIIVGDVAASLKELASTGFDASVFCIIVTRGHNHDEEALFHLATTHAGYVGLIGSKRKIRLIFEDLRAKGIPEEALARVHAPLGLPIGSQTVPEIAVSIVAELIACRNVGDAHGLRSK